MTETLDVPAAQRLVGGLLLPKPVAGHPALELCNTLAGWRADDGPARDYLVDYDHLVALARGLDLLGAARANELHAEAAERPEDAARVLREARRLRADLYTVLTGTHDTPGTPGTIPADPETLDRLNAALARAATVRRLVDVGSDGPRWVLADTGLRAPLDALAWQARLLLDSPDAARVRACPGTGCGWLLLDPRGQRRWCVMSLCGNRAKARAFAARGRRTAS